MGVPLDKIKYHHLTTIKQIDKLERHMMDSVSKFAIDTETTGQDKLHRVHVLFRTIFGVSIYFPHHAIWIEGLDDDTPFTKRVFKLLKNILEDKEKIKILHNATFDYNGFVKHGIKMQLPIWDTKSMAVLYDENDTRGGLMKYKIGSKGVGLPLKPLAWKYLGWKYDVLDFDKMDIKEFTLAERIAYGGNDVVAPYYLAEFYYPQLKRQHLLDVFDIEMEIIPAIAHMQRTGAVVDIPYLVKEGEKVAKDLVKIETDVQRLAKKEFNLRSSAQMREVLYDKLKYPVKGYTDGGKSKIIKPSTNTDTLKLVKTALEEKNKDTAIIDKILLYRSIEQIDKMYIRPFPKKHAMPDGRIYPQFPQNETATGRLKSRNPNFQNLKKEIKDPKHPLYHYAYIVKHSVMAPEGFWILTADYSQVEYRVLAHESGDEKLIAGYCSGKTKDGKPFDIHKLVAADMFEIPYDDITDDQRQDAKHLNFGVVYGMTAYGLGLELGISTEEAQLKIDYYFSRFPGIKIFIDEVHRNVVRRGYVTTITGRRRRMPEVHSPDRWIREAALRQSVNSIIQGGATGDINKMALIDLHNELVDDNKIFMPLDVHDEIMLYVHDSVIMETIPKMQEIMESVCELKIPLVAEVEKKRRWVE